MTTEAIAAIDMGGTRLRVALMDAQANVLERTVEPTRSQEGPEEIAQRIGDVVRGMVEKRKVGRLLGVGAAIASPLDLDGVLHHPPNLLGWKVVPFKALLQRQFSVPVFMGNDATLAVLGEHAFGAGRGVNDLVYLTVSTGVGGGVITGGKLLVGTRGLAGELGHIIIDRNGPQHHCGHRGCLESLVSGSAIARRAAERLGPGRPSMLPAMAAGQGGLVRAEHVFEAAAKGDALSQEIVDEVARDLGLGIASLIHMFNPAKFIVGGGVSQNWGVLEAKVTRVVRETAMPGFLDGLEITTSKIGDGVGLTGAVAYVLRETGRLP